MASLMDAGKLLISTSYASYTKPVPSMRMRALTQFPPQGCVSTEASRAESDALAGGSSSSLQPVSRAYKHAFKQGLAGAAASLVLAAACAPAGAYNVRLQDVENKAMQAGVQAATEQRWEEAERFFQIVLKEEPSSASAYSNMGNVHLSQRRPEQAVADFSRAIQLAPEAPVPYLNRAIAEEQLGVNAASAGKADEAAQHYQAAIQDCRDAQSRDSKEFAAFFNEGNVQARMGQFKSALAAYSRAADLAPGIAGYRLRQAELLFQNDRAHDADVMMRGVVRKSPNYAEAHAALAAVEWASGQKGLAEDHFDKAVTLDGRWSKMGYIRQQTRWPPALYQAMERFLSIASVDDDRISS